MFYDLSFKREKEGLSLSNLSEDVKGEVAAVMQSEAQRWRFVLFLSTKVHSWPWKLNYDSLKKIVTQCSLTRTHLNFTAHLSLFKGDFDLSPSIDDLWPQSMLWPVMFTAFLVYKVMHNLSFFFTSRKSTTTEIKGVVGHFLSLVIIRRLSGN